MPKLLISIDGVVVKEAVLSKERTTLGRRPYNDIVFDNLAVSGEHAVLLLTEQGVTLQDLESTNGTFVGKERITSRPLQDSEYFTIGKFKVQFLASGPLPGPGAALDDAVAEPPPASIRVLTGTAEGRQLGLSKPVTTVGKAGVAVAAITRKPDGYEFHHVEGGGRPTVNGAPVGHQPVRLKDGDRIEIAGTQMRFVQPGSAL